MAVFYTGLTVMGVFLAWALFIERQRINWAHLLYVLIIGLSLVFYALTYFSEHIVHLFVLWGLVVLTIMPGKKFEQKRRIFIKAGTGLVLLLGLMLTLSRTGVITERQTVPMMIRFWPLAFVLADARKFGEGKKRKQATGRRDLRAEASTLLAVGLFFILVNLVFYLGNPFYHEMLHRFYEFF